MLTYENLNNFLLSNIDDVYQIIYSNQHSIDFPNEKYSEFYKYETQNIIDDIRDNILYLSLHKINLSIEVMKTIIVLAEGNHIGNSQFIMIDDKTLEEFTKKINNI